MVKKKNGVKMFADRQLPQQLYLALEKRKIGLFLDWSKTKRVWMQKETAFSFFYEIVFL